MVGEEKLIRVEEGRKLIRLDDLAEEKLFTLTKATSDVFYTNI